MLPKERALEMDNLNLGQDYNHFIVIFLYKCVYVYCTVNV